jgi:hypothetical protein
MALAVFTFKIAPIAARRARNSATDFATTFWIEYQQD